jgi:RNA polymerase sigma-70 factor (ECF subfamily)
MSVNEAIERAYRAGRHAFPLIDLPLAIFAEFAEARVEHATIWGGDEQRAADLYLAAACLAQIPAAIAEFLERFGARIPQYIARVARDRETVSEVRQIIATRCLVAEPDRPAALNSYSGAGSLEGWVRATAVREALALSKRAEQHHDGYEAALEAQMAWADHEISMIKKVYSAPVSAAFATACRQLPSDQRALLRLHFAQGVTTAQLATMYGVSRATLVRRLTEAREALVALVKNNLRSSMGIEERDFLSVMKLVNSQLDLRLSLVLQDQGRGGGAQSDHGAG